MSNYSKKIIVFFSLSNNTSARTGTALIPAADGSHFVPYKNNIYVYVNRIVYT